MLFFDDWFYFSSKMLSCLLVVNENNQLLHLSASGAGTIDAHNVVVFFGAFALKVFETFPYMNVHIFHEY